MSDTSATGSPYSCSCCTRDPVRDSRQDYFWNPNTAYLPSSFTSIPCICQPPEACRITTPFSFEYNLLVPQGKGKLGELAHRICLRTEAQRLDHLVFHCPLCWATPLSSVRLPVVPRLPGISVPHVQAVRVFMNTLPAHRLVTISGKVAFSLTELNGMYGFASIVHSLLDSFNFSYVIRHTGPRRR